MVRLLFLTLISALLPLSLATSFVSLIQTRQNSSASASDLNSSSPETRKLAIVDNDVSETGSLTPLILAKAGYKLLGLTSSTGDTKASDGAAHFAQLFSEGNMSCVPVFEGAATPLLRTNESLRAWEDEWGALVWEGAFRGDYLQGDAQFPEGKPSESQIKATKKMSAAQFLVEQVRQYPGEISFVVAGPFTNMAIAHKLDPNFLKNIKELVVMGGFIDFQYNFSSGDELLADLWSDFNLLFDPEAAQMTINNLEVPLKFVGNAANSFIPDDDFFARLNSTLENVTNSSIDQALPSHYFAEIFLRNRGQGIFPLWDESASAVLVDPTVSTKILSVPLTVDTSANSWSYGFLKLFNPSLLPKSSSRYGFGDIVLELDVEKFKDIIINTLTTDFSSYCDDHDY